MPFSHDEKSFSPNPNVLGAGTYLFPLRMRIGMGSHVVMQAINLSEPTTIDGSDTDGIPLPVLAAAYFYNSAGSVDFDPGVGAFFESTPGVWVYPDDELPILSVGKESGTLKTWAREANNDTLANIMACDNTMNLARDYLEREAQGE